MQPILNDTYSYLSLQSCLKLCHKKEHDKGLEQVENCLQAASCINDASQRSYLMSRCLCIMSTINRGRRDFVKAQRNLDLALQVRGPLG